MNAFNHVTKPGDAAAASVSAGAALKVGGGPEHRYHVEHFENYHADGRRCTDAACVSAWQAGRGVWHEPRLVWEDTFNNLVTTAGKNKYLDATLKSGLTSPAWYVGLVTGPGSGNTYAAADTMASHAGWAEDTTYSGSNRPAFTPGTISGGSVDNSAAKAVFNISNTATIAGCFMADVQANSPGNTGTLLGVGNFTGGDRALQNGDTLNVTVTATQS